MRRLFVVLALTVIPAFASAKCGWLLMLPPTFGDRADTSRPILDWVQDSAFDSAEQCEAYRSDAMGKFHPRLGNQSATVFFAQYVNARCLPASQVPVR